MFDKPKMKFDEPNTWQRDKSDKIDAENREVKESVIGNFQNLDQRFIQNGRVIRKEG